jgi:hypothetical protein
MTRVTYTRRLGMMGQEDRGYQPGHLDENKHSVATMKSLVTSASVLKNMSCG